MTPDHSLDVAEVCSALSAISAVDISGSVRSVAPMAVEIAGLERLLAMGDRVTLEARGGETVLAEIVAANGGLLRAAPFGQTQGLGAGGRARVLLGSGALRGRLGRSGIAPSDA